MEKRIHQEKVIDRNEQKTIEENENKTPILKTMERINENGEKSTLHGQHDQKRMPHNIHSKEQDVESERKPHYRQ